MINNMSQIIKFKLITILFNADFYLKKTSYECITGSNNLNYLVNDHGFVA
jgi:hypothetical protein